MMVRIFFLVLFVMLNFAVAGSGKIIGKVSDRVSGNGIAKVNISINQKIVALTDIDGEYVILNLSPAIYSLTAKYSGYEKQIIKNIKVISDSTTVVNIKLKPKNKKEKPVKSTKIIPPPPPTANEVYELFSVASVERFDNHNTEEYSRIEGNTFSNVIENPLSTFAADVDASSYSNSRRFIMKDELPYKDAVRIEEFINYFSYDYPAPKGEHPLSINMEYSDCPWNKEHKLIHIGLRGKEILKEDQKASNLVFLLDVSGSMNYPKKLPLLKKSFKLLLEQLSPNDKIAIVTYAGSAGLVLPSTSGEEKDKIFTALENLHAGGSTAGGEGIELAYKIAKENFIKDGNNRVILATDGDFNVGISSTSELVRFIESKRDEGIFLTVLGFGMGNYKDDRLQELADRGNGNHAYIDNILEAKKVLVNEINSTLYTIAKDVKIQVEFNPVKIKSYRLLGYVNRKMEAKDFKNDKKDAGEIGAGHTVTVLYEVVEANSSTEDKSDLKYQEIKIKNSAKESDEVLTVKIRYKKPDEDLSREFSEVLTDKYVKISETSNNFRFSAAVAEYAMILRDSKFKGTATIKTARVLAKSAMGKDPFGYRAEFINLLNRTEFLLD